MSYGISFRSTMAFSGDYVNDLPVVNPPLYQLPVGSPRSRHSADRGVTASGGVVESWSQAEGDPTVLTVPSSSTAPVAMVVDGRAAIRFNGVSDMLSAVSESNQPYTLAVVSKLNNWASTDSLKILVGGTPPGESRTAKAGEISVNSTGYLAYAGTLQSIGGPNASYGSIDPNGWHVSVASFNGASTYTQVDDRALTRNPGSLPRGGLTVGGGSSGLYSQVDVAEVVVWPVSMTAGQVADVVATMRTAHGLV